MPSLVILHANSRFDNVAWEFIGTTMSIMVGSHTRETPFTKKSYVILTVARDNPVETFTWDIVALGILTNAFAMPLRTGNDMPDCRQSRENGSASHIYTREWVFIMNMFARLLNKNVRVILSFKRVHPKLRQITMGRVANDTPGCIMDSIWRASSIFKS